MITTVSVGTAPRGYDVLIGPRLMDRAGERLAALSETGRITLVAQPAVADHHGERMAAALEAGGLAVDLVVGEGRAFAPARGDLVGLFGGGRMNARSRAAKTAVDAGAKLVRLPTTLLAQVECVANPDEPAPPCAVLADLDVLATLSPPQAKAGYAQLMRHALAADARLFGWLEAHGRSVIELEVPALAHAVVRCVELKATLPPERLALGDAFARALSDESGGALAHEDAVSLGCALAFQFASTTGLCPADHAERATWNLAAVGLAVRLEESPGGPASARRLLDRLSGAPLTLPRALGDAAPVTGVERGALHDFLIAQGALP